MRPTYLIDHFAGIRGHFIGSLILQLHRNAQEPVEYSEAGHAHNITWSYFHNKTNLDLLPKNTNYINDIEFIGEEDDPDPLIINVMLNAYPSIDYDKLIAKHPVLKKAAISVTIDYFPELIANDMYKTYLILGPESDYAKSFFQLYLLAAKNDANCRTGLSNVGELNDYELSVLVKYRIEHANFPEMLYKYENRQATFPDSIPTYTIQYPDIMNDKNKVLTILEDMTGCKRTVAIEKSYDNYLYQQHKLYSTKMSWLYPK